MFFFFFFQAEDGIRDWSVTGVQTCALPISLLRRAYRRPVEDAHLEKAGRFFRQEIGRASCRGRGEISGGGGLFKKKKKEERGRREDRGRLEECDVREGETSMRMSWDGRRMR